MANIKIAQLTNATTISDSDIVLIEDATQTKKMTVANLKELLGINAKVPNSKIVTFSTAKQVTTDEYSGQYFYDLVVTPQIDDTNNYIIVINNNYELAATISMTFYPGFARIFFGAPVVDKPIIFRVAGIRIA